MIELINSIDTWPKAIVASTCVFGATCVIVAFLVGFSIVANDSKWPWEK